MTRTARDLDYRSGDAVLLRYSNGARALWVEQEEYPTRYSINDINTGIPILGTEDLDEIIALWKRHQEWTDEDGYDAS